MMPPWWAWSIACASFAIPLAAGAVTFVMTLPSNRCSSWSRRRGMRCTRYGFPAQHDGRHSWFGLFWW